jgi:c-opsin
VERLRIIRSRSQRMRIEQRYPATYILSVWVFAFLVTIPPLLGWGKYSIEGTGVSCSVDWESTTFNSLTYIAFLFVIGFLIPVIAIVSSYVGVCITLHQVRTRNLIKF